MTESNDVQQEVQDLRREHEVQAATQAGAQATQAATQAGQAATTAAAQAGLVGAFVAFIVGIFLGMVITKANN